MGLLFQQAHSLHWSYFYSIPFNYVNLPTFFDVLNLIGWNSGVIEAFEIVYSSDGMKICSYDVDCVVLG
jgi:hypothetical protein